MILSKGVVNMMIVIQWFVQESGCSLTRKVGIWRVIIMVSFLFVIIAKVSGISSVVVIAVGTVVVRLFYIYVVIFKTVVVVSLDFLVYLRVGL